MKTGWSSQFKHMEIWRGYGVGHGRFVRRVFWVASLLPWPFVVLAMIGQQWHVAIVMILLGLFTYFNYRRMRHFTEAMERWVTRRRAHADGNPSGNPHPPFAPFDPVEAAVFGAVRGYVCEGGIVQSVKIILLCMASAVLYGICHDQVTARVCVEYFTVGHAPIFSTESPTLLAFGWGALATWWVGLILGVLAASVSRAGSWPKLDAGRLVRPIACLLIVMAVASLLAGITGYQLAEASGLVLPEPLGSRVPKDRHHLFFADSLAHLAAYGVGFLGGLVVCVRVLVQRCRTARAVPPTKDAAARADLVAEHGVVVISRWTARTIGIPLFGLLVVLVHGDGVPDPLAASLQENLSGIVVLVMLLGLLLAWKWEGAGSLLILGGLVLYAIANQPVLLNIVLAPWLVTGLLFGVCWVGKQKAGGVH